MGQVLLHPTERVDTMTTRAKHSLLTGAGIVLILLAIAGRQLATINEPAPAPVGDADSSSDDDDSGRFDHLPEAPKE